MARHSLRKRFAENLDRTEKRIVGYLRAMPEADAEWVYFVAQSLKEKQSRDAAIAHADRMAWPSSAPPVDSAAGYVSPDKDPQVRAALRKLDARQRLLLRPDAKVIQLFTRPE